MPFDRHTKSGQIAACSHAKNVPVRPQPDDFIGDQVHAEFVAQRAEWRQV